MKSQLLFAHRARRIFFLIHLWIGLIAGLWFALVGVTGSVLAWRSEIGNWEIRNRYVQEKPSPQAQKITIAQALAAVKKVHTESKPRQLATVTLPTDELPFYSFTLGESRRTRQTVLVDPYSAQVHPPFRRSELGVVKIQQYHQRLLAGMRGYLVNGFFNFLVVPLLISGLWLWWPTKLKHLKTHLSIKRGASLKRRLFDLHNVMGIYLYPLLLVTTVSGAVIVYQHVEREGLSAYLQGETANDARQKAGGQNQQSRPQRGDDDTKTPQSVPNGKVLSADEVLPQARAASPGQQLISLKIPSKKLQPFEATFRQDIGIANSRTLYLDAYSGKVLGEKPPEINFSRVNKALHLGVFGGFISKILYTLTGFMPLGLFITGAWLWLGKKIKKRRTA